MTETSSVATWGQAWTTWRWTTEGTRKLWGLMEMFCTWNRWPAHGSVSVSNFFKWMQFLVCVTQVDRKQLQDGIIINLDIIPQILSQWNNLYPDLASAKLNSHTTSTGSAAQTGFHAELSCPQCIRDFIIFNLRKYFCAVDTVKGIKRLMLTKNTFLTIAFRSEFHF